MITNQRSCMCHNLLLKLCAAVTGQQNELRFAEVTRQINCRNANQMNNGVCHPQFLDRQHYNNDFVNNLSDKTH